MLDVVQVAERGANFAVQERSEEPSLNPDGAEVEIAPPGTGPQF